MSKNVTLIFLFLFLVSGASAELVYQQNTNIDLTLPCINNGTLCSESATCNISVLDPKNKGLINNTLMTNQVSYHNYSLDDNFTRELGEYSSVVTCIDGLDTGSGTFNFLVTRSGKTINEGASLTNLGLMFAVFAIFLLVLYFNIKIPYKNPTNMRGETLMITKTKYLKMGLILITHALFNWFLNLLIAVSDNYSDVGQFYGFVETVFNISINLVWPLFALIFVWVIFEIVRDVNKQKIIEKFGRA